MCNINYVLYYAAKHLDMTCTCLLVCLFACLFDCLFDLWVFHDV